jgi:glycosyltransferase involved in cell wall biosynthesis
VAGTLLEAPLPPGELNDAVRAQAQENYRALIHCALERWPFDLVHMHSLDFHAYLPPEGVPVLVTLHLPPDWYPDWIFRLQRTDTWLQCVSSAQFRCCPPSPLLRLPVENGVPVDRFPFQPRKRGFVLALGRICPEKGFHLALDAAREAGVPAVIAGEVFRYRAHQEYFSREIGPRLNGAQRFIGPVGFTRKRFLLGAARCLLVPSLVPETSSLVSMEALACGTPVIAFPSGALPEIVEHGRTGFLVKDVQEMAAAIRRVDEIDPWECRRVARQRFNSERMIAEYLRRYEWLACRKASSGDGQVRARLPSYRLA